MTGRKATLVAVAVIAAIALAALLAKNALVEHLIESQAKKALGLSMSIESVETQLLEGSIRCRGITVHNLDGFGTTPLVDMPEISLNCDVWSLFQREPQIETLVLNVREIGLSRNKEGMLNLVKLKEASEATAKVAENQQTSQEKKPGSLVIGLLQLTLGQIRFVDQYQVEQPVERVLRVGVDHQRFPNVKSGEAIARTIIMATLLEASSRKEGLADFARLVECIKPLAGIEEQAKIETLEKMLASQATTPPAP